MVASLVCAIAGAVWSDDQPATEFIGKLFFCVFFVNTLMLSFEFPRMTDVAVVIGAIAIIFALLWLNNYSGVFEFIQRLIADIHLRANSEFYLFIGGTLLLVFTLSWIIARFDYW